MLEEGEPRSLYETCDGHRFWLGSDSYVDQCIRNTGVFEPALTDAFRRLVRAGDVVLDVGANIGYYAVLASKLVGARGSVYCFEPTKEFRPVLERNLAENRVENARVFDYGLSNKTQELDIAIGASSASLHWAGPKPSSGSERIRLRTLDECVQEWALDRLSLIKVDVDGHEPLFLQGAWQTLERFDPIVLLEVSHPHYLAAGVTPAEFYKDLKARGYRIYHEAGLVELCSEAEFLIKCGNFAYSSNIAIRRGPLL